MAPPSSLKFPVSIGYNFIAKYLIGQIKDFTAKSGIGIAYASIHIKKVAVIALYKNVVSLR
jgi:hypothetical protein